ncbi:MAG: hypothetical protein AAF570_16690, partial [Bacteroidota bacterium]
AGDELFHAIRLIHAMEVLNEGGKIEDVKAFFEQPIVLPASVVEYLSNGAPANYDPGDDKPDENQMEALQKLSANMNLVRQALAETKVKHSWQVVPKQAEPSKDRKDIDLEPNFQLLYSTKHVDSFSGATINLLKEKGFDTSQIPAGPVRKTLQEMHSKVSTALSNLLNTHSVTQVWLNGRLRSVKELASLQYHEAQLDVFTDHNKYMRPLGIGELRTVEQVNVRYEIGEIAHIENVLQGETKIRDHVRESTSETFTDTETQREETTERELATTSRHELSSETREVQRESAQFAFDVNVSASFGPYLDISTGVNYGTQESKEKSKTASANYAKDVVEKAASKIRESVRERRTSRSIQKITETNNHTLSNTSGGHIVGIYRWLNKVYDAQVRTHGLRMMYEFNIPEPAAFYLYSQTSDPDKQIGIEKPLPPIFDPGPDGGPPAPLSPLDLNEGTYAAYGTQYKVQGLTPPPVEEFVIVEAISEKSAEGNLFKKLNFEIPEGYIPRFIVGAGSLEPVGGAEKSMNVHAAIGKSNISSEGLSFDATPGVMSHSNIFTIRGDVDLAEFSDKRYDTAIQRLPISLIFWHAYGISCTIALTCERSDNLMKRWQIDTYEKIMAAYYELKAQYDEKARAFDFGQGIQIQGKNPLRNE